MTERCGAATSARGHGSAPVSGGRMPSEPLASRRITQVLQEGFADPAVGPSRRRGQSDLLDDWLRALWGRADGPAQGAALAAIRSPGRRSAGPATQRALVPPLLPGAGCGWLRRG